MDPILVGFLTTGATLFVTAALFAIDYVRRWLGDNRRHRETIVKDVLATVERASRSALRAPLSERRLQQRTRLRVHNHGKRRAGAFITNDGAVQPLIQNNIGARRQGPGV
ncbi:MAG TPA: hypothetical protein VIP82_15710 [Microbacterium sp.]|uniref:hypothetical protein n=1 Tax=Microbacterium sp. TaxID=51671 RepID=UPI002F931C7F